MGCKTSWGPTFGHLETIFKPLQLSLKSKTADAGDALDMFGTAAALQRLHGIVPGLCTSSGHIGDT